MREKTGIGSEATAVLSEERFDVVVLGGGSAAEELCDSLVEETSEEQVPLAIAVVEAELVGGECPYLACMPSKALLRSAALRRLSSRAWRLGVEEGGRGSAQAAWREAVRRRDLVAEERDDSEHANSLESSGVKLFRGVGKIEAWGSLLVHQGQETRRLIWKDLVISTGSRPALPPIEGLAEAEPWTSDDALSSAELPESVAILGGGPVGCELAEMYSGYLAEGCVHLIESSGRLLSGEEEMISTKLGELFSRRGICLHLAAELAVISSSSKAGRQVLQLSNGERFEVARVVLATGREPATADLQLEQLGIKPLESSGALPVDDQCLVVAEKKSGRRVFAIGDVNGVAPFTHVAKYQGRIVASILAGNETRADERAFPRCVYTDPPVAAVGLTGEVARGDGLSVCEVEMELAETARAEADGRLYEDEMLEEAAGWLKLVADREKGTLVGASVIGPRADEWLGELTLAIRAEIPLAVLADTVHPFPTYSEALTPLYRQLARHCVES